MPVSTRSKRHKPEVNRKEEMTDQSIFKNLLEEALGPITQELNMSFNYCSSGSGQDSVIPVVCNVPE